MPPEKGVGRRPSTSSVLIIGSAFKQSAHRGQLRICLQDIGAMDQYLGAWGRRSLEYHHLIPGTHAIRWSGR